MMRQAVFPILALVVPALAAAGIDQGDLPAGTMWYLHADLAEMRSTAAGRPLYSWLEGEVIVEINDELGMDLSEEVDRLTAFSAGKDHYVAIVEGRISKQAQDRVMRLSEVRESITEYKHRGLTYYHGSGAEARQGDRVERVPGYFSFAIPGRLIASSSENTLKSLLDNNGVAAGATAPDNAVFVLSADKEFVQAGMRTADFADDGDDWQSNILRNTEQAALLVSDQGGLVAVVARLVSADASVTQSLASIVRGLLALQMFSTELEPGIAEVLRNTRVDVEGDELSVSTVIDPQMILRELER